MRSLAGLAERYYPALYSVNTVGLVNEFAEQMKKELDFRMEANNLRRFCAEFRRYDTIHVPEVYMDLCTRRVITMEFLDGINISDTKRLRDEGYNLQLIARRGAILVSGLPSNTVFSMLILILVILSFCLTTL